LQYQCIGCAHCIDACDDVMAKVGYAPGLIRYTTEHALEGKPTRVLRPRVIGYAAALAAMSIAFMVALVNRNLVGIDVIRDRGELYHVERVAGRHIVRNDYTLKLLNKTQRAQTLTLSVSSAAFDHIDFEGPTEVTVDPGEVPTVPVSLAMDESRLADLHA